MNSSNLSNILILEDSKGRREIVLEDQIYSLGRDTTCDIHLVSEFVSRHHATLLRHPTEGGYYYQIIDGNLKGQASANGIRVNGCPLKTHPLKNEDEIVFGPQARAIYYRLKRDTTDTIPPDEFDIDDPYNSGSPRNPSPLIPTCGQEAIPDNGTSDIP